MAINVAINGFGRIGRGVLRAARQTRDINIVAINDLEDISDLAYLMRYDSVYGRADGIDYHEDNLLVDGRQIPVYSEQDPNDLPWDSHDVDVAFESTGVFRTKDEAGAHLDAGADKVLISAPAKDDVTPQIVYGVNHDEYDGEAVVSNASCTTNCLAPMARTLEDAFGIRSGLITTVHAYTGSQRLIDTPHAKRRRGRAAAENIVPTTTGAANAVTTVIPELKGKLDGMAMRVPTPNGSVTDLVVDLEEDAAIEDVNDAFREAADGRMDGVLRVSDEELVSRDILGDPHSVIVDGPATMSLNNGMVKILGWYDNEYGFSNRMIDVARHIA